ncbi:MAG: DUF4405 domain-containing protein [Desulfatiglandales bacterium]
MKKNSARWVVNVLSFLLFALLSVTGLINRLILQRGYELRGSSLRSLRHFLVEIHQWAGMLFIVVVAVHVILHWNYIKAKLVQPSCGKGRE